MTNVRLDAAMVVLAVAMVVLEGVLESVTEDARAIVMVVMAVPAVGILVQITVLDVLDAMDAVGAEMVV